MKDFGVKIEVLNRFKKPSEVKEILERLQKGEIDILAGLVRDGLLKAEDAAPRVEMTVEEFKAAMGN